MTKDKITLIDVAGGKNPISLKVKSFEIQISPTPSQTELKSIIPLDLKSFEASLFKRWLTRASVPSVGPEFKNQRFSCLADQYIFVWNKLREYGLPVVPNVRKLSSDEIVQTNLEASGYSVYDSKIDILETRQTQANDSLFARIPLEDIREKAQHYAKIATNNGVRLAYDGAFHVVVNGKGEWDLLLLDLGSVSVGDKKIDKLFGSLSDYNSDRARYWTQFMGQAQEVVIATKR